MNDQKNYAREAKDPQMESFTVSNGKTSNRRKVQPITFTQNDTTGVHYPHCDVLVIIAVVARNSFKRMLMDNRSSINIIYGATFDKMEVDHELTSVGFTDESIIPRGKIILATKIGVAPLMAHNFMEFSMIDHHSAYHGILGRLALKEL